MRFVAWLDEIPDDELALTAGGKGASLCRLTRAGFAVPEAFIVCSEAFNEFMMASGLKDEVLAATGSIDFSNSTDSSLKAKQARDMITAAAIPSDIAQAIQSFYIKLAGDLSAEDSEAEDLRAEEDESAVHPVAVRSSGTAEDLDDASFAGQMDTFLNVEGLDDVLRSIKECWASLYNDSALFYRREQGFSEHESSIAVVIQRMVASEKAGVMFTANPITKSADRCLIEGSWGLGEAIVSGIVTPDSYMADKDGQLLEAFVSCKETMVVRKADGSGVEEIEVPEQLQEAQVLDEDEIKELVELAVRLEEYFEKPQDVEWAIESKRLYLLQSRPITTLG